MTAQSTIAFNGLAPISAGSNVIMYVDNPNNPTAAYSIYDTSHGIAFRSSEPEKAPRRGVAKIQAVPDYVAAKVVRTEVHVLSNETELTVMGLKPSPPPS